MSLATLAAPEAVSSDRPSVAPADYLSLASAARLTGLHETTILRCALAGDIRTRQRGRRTLICAEDVRKIAG
jgi:hypothetical protein